MPAPRDATGEAMVCGNCQWFDRSRSWCRLAPQVVAVDGLPLTTWPAVQSVDWCSLFTHRAPTEAERAEEPF